MLVNLMKLEMKKNKMGWYFKGVVIANLLMVLFMWLITYLEELDGATAFINLSEALLVIGTLVRVTFVVFSSVLFAKLIIDEYKNKTISFLFTYPISRKKLILSKILLITGLTFIVILISNVFVAGSFITMNHYFHFVEGRFTADMVSSEMINIVVQGLAATGMSLICLYFGMRKKSVPATIVSSTLIIGIINSSTNGFSVSSIIAVPFMLALIGVMIAYFTFRNIDRVDIV
ncbi:ABC transporter permease [Paenibacillus sp. FA6]|uniref:ABC transporter permease n=1 Tax=Paenibacillus sp. FA6 TaxID=3413029 RepID=UPI003F656C9F